MKIRMILGYYGEPNGGEAALGQVFLSPVYEIDPEDDEEWLKTWADEEFEEYEIWDMDVSVEHAVTEERPPAAVRPDVRPELEVEE